MFRDDFTLSKRHLGLLFFAAGGLALLAIFAVDFVDSGREGGIGPTQRIALTIAALTALVGLTLIPLGERPA